MAGEEGARRRDEERRRKLIEHLNSYGEGPARDPEKEESENAAYLARETEKGRRPDPSGWAGGSA